MDLMPSLMARTTKGGIPINLMKKKIFIILPVLLITILALSGCGNQSKIETGTSDKKEISPEIQKNCLGFLTPDGGAAETINKAGGAWARPHPGPFAWGWIETENDKFNFKHTDELVIDGQEHNVALAPTLWPYADWDQKTCHDDKCAAPPRDEFYPNAKFGMAQGIPEYRCNPCSNDNYKDFLTKLVDRYDGDGSNDMPKLEIPIKYWEISNEPSMGQDSENTLNFYMQDEAGYVELLKQSYAIIKEACPDCQVVQGGAAGSSPDMLDYWDKVFELGGGQYFDIANIHYIGQGDINSLNVKPFKKILDKHNLDKPIWVTEGEMRSEDSIKSSFLGALDAGASKIFSVNFHPEKDMKFSPDSYSEVFPEVAKQCPK